MAAGSEGVLDADGAVTGQRREDGAALEDIYRRLREHFGHRDWWPGETPFEVAVGAVLTQNTAWSNVERAMANLKAAGALEPGKLLALSREQLAELVRPSGYFNQKALRLRALVRYFQECCNWDLGRLEAIPTATLRRELLSLNGIGPETADSILLYALGRPVFVVDAYTIRVLTRVGLLQDGPKYGGVQAFFQDNLPRDTALFNDFHAQFVALGKDYCRKTPRCGDCPLKETCKYGAAVRKD